MKLNAFFASVLIVLILFFTVAVPKAVALPAYDYIYDFVWDLSYNAKIAVMIELMPSFEGTQGERAVYFDLHQGERENGLYAAWFDRFVWDQDFGYVYQCVVNYNYYAQIDACASLGNEFAQYPPEE